MTLRRQLVALHFRVHVVLVSSVSSRFVEHVPLSSQIRRPRACGAESLTATQDHQETGATGPPHAWGDAERSPRPPQCIESRGAPRGRPPDPRHSLRDAAHGTPPVVLRGVRVVGST